MRDAVVLQYAGFEDKEGMREYTFIFLRSGGQCSEYFVTIPNAAFIARQVRYQDAPEICSLRVHREFGDQTDHPPDSSFAITDEELADYKDAHTPNPNPARL
jgi:hypothetical protein